MKTELDDLVTKASDLVLGIRRAVRFDADGRQIDGDPDARIHGFAILAAADMIRDYFVAHGCPEIWKDDPFWISTLNDIGDEVSRRVENES